jgi:hypothetical protein
MSNLDPRIEAIRDQYGLANTDFWQIPQNKQWVCKHAALEIVATKANVIWSPPQIIQADTAGGIAVLAVTGKMGERTEWATGEASPKNNKNSYPWAMAEKRAKDRVVLKLVGIHGLVYSEDEMPPSVITDHQAGDQADKPKEPPKKDARPVFTQLVEDLRKLTSKEDIRRWIADPDVKALRQKLPADWDAKLRDEAASHGRSLEASNANDFPGDRPSIRDLPESAQNYMAG